MTWHLVKDVLRRTGWRTIFPAFVAYLVWSSSAKYDFSLPTTFALAMLCASWMPPTWAIATVLAREVRMMPVSDLELWRARWWLAVVVPGVIGFAGKALALASGHSSGGDATPGLDTALLSTLYDIALAGIVLMFLPLVERFERPLRLAGHRIAAAVWGWVATLVFMGGWAWPLIFPEALITRIGEFDVGRGAVLGGLLALGVGSAMWRRVPRPSGKPFYYDVEADERRPDTPTREAAPISRRSHLAGLAYFIWTDWKRSAAMVVLVVAAYATAGGIFIVLTAPPATIVDGLRAIGLLPFDDRTSGAPAFVALTVIGMFSVAGYRQLLALSDWLVDMPRHFRALPLPARAYVGLLLALPLLGWLTLYAVLALVHVAATAAWPSPVRLEVVVLLVGVDALARVMSLRFRGDKLQWNFVMMMAMLVVIGVASETGYGKTLFRPGTGFFWGTMMFAAAAGAFYATLARSRAAYARR